MGPTHDTATKSNARRLFARHSRKGTKPAPEYQATYDLGREAWDTLHDRTPAQMFDYGATKRAKRSAEEAKKTAKAA